MNFKEVGEFNRLELLPEIEVGAFWNWLNLRKTKSLEHQAVDDIVLRFQSIEGFHDPMEFFDSMICTDYFVQQFFPNTMRIVGEFANGREIGKVVIAKLKAGGEVKTHIDEGEYCKQHDRYHFVVTTNPGSYLVVNGQLVQMLPNEIWWLDNKSPHSAFNNGGTDRIHIIVDLKKGEKPLTSQKGYEADFVTNAKIRLEANEE